MYQIAYKPENVQQIIIQVAYKEEILQSQMTKQNLLCDSFQKYIFHIYISATSGINIGRLKIIKLNIDKSIIASFRRR